MRKKEKERNTNLKTEREKCATERLSEMKMYLLGKQYAVENKEKLKRKREKE